MLRCLRGLRSEQLVEVVADLVPRSNNGDEVPPDLARTVSWAMRSSGSAVATTGVPNLRLMATTWWRRANGAGKNLSRGGIDPVRVEVDELEVVFAGHPANGVDVAHITTIGRLAAEIELESNCLARRGRARPTSACTSPPFILAPWEVHRSPSDRRTSSRIVDSLSILSLWRQRDARSSSRLPKADCLDATAAAACRYRWFAPFSDDPAHHHRSPIPTLLNT